jgi:hypothetical protein
MDNASTRRHPLHSTTAQYRFITQVVAMAHLPIKHVGHGFKATVGVSRKARQIVIRIFVEKTVQHQKGVNARAGGLAYTAQQTYTGTVTAGAGGDTALDGTVGHLKTPRARGNADMNGMTPLLYLPCRSGIAKNSD